MRLIVTNVVSEACKRDKATRGVESRVFSSLRLELLSRLKSPRKKISHQNSFGNPACLRMPFAVWRERIVLFIGK
jgi:hypothetical protein